MPRNVTEFAQRYASRYRLAIRETLGSGIHGAVHVVQAQTAPGGTALKVFLAGEFYAREHSIYTRLAEAGVRHVLGFAVPQMLRADDELLGLEMTIVERPFVLDFAGAYLDNDAPQFDDSVW